MNGREIAIALAIAIGVGVVWAAGWSLFERLFVRRYRWKGDDAR